jgi:hypothetical protein
MYLVLRGKIARKQRQPSAFYGGTDLLPRLRYLGTGLVERAAVVNHHVSARQAALLGRLCVYASARFGFVHPAPLYQPLDLLFRGAGDHPDGIAGIDPGAFEQLDGIDYRHGARLFVGRVAGVF